MSVAVLLMICRLGQAQEAPPAEPPPPPPSTQVVVTLADGQTLRGLADPAVLEAWKAGEPLEIRVGEGLGLALPAGLATEVAPAAIGERLPHTVDTSFSSSTRHFFAPTAIPLKQGTGYISQMEVLATVVDYGVTDWLTVEAGAIIPLALFSLTMGEGTDFLVGMAAVKAAVEVAPQVHVAAGAFGVASPEFQLGLPFAETTLGDVERNVTFGVGTILVTEMDDVALPVVVGGTWRVRPNLGLVTENWLVFVDGEFTAALDTLGVRFLPEQGRWSVDLALASGYAERDWQILPVPWLDVSWHF